MPENLWGDLDLKIIQTPKSFLEEQGEILKERTHGRLDWEVESEQRDDNTTVHRFKIVAPKLENYTHTVIEMLVPIQLYPLTITDVTSSDEHNCENEVQFIAALKGILSSLAVRKIIRALLSQVAEVPR